MVSILPKTYYNSTASYLYKNGVSLKDIQEWLGHSNISITADLYIDLDSEIKNKTAQIIENAFNTTFNTEDELKKVLVDNLDLQKLLANAIKEAINI